MNGAEWPESFGGHAAFHQRQLDAVLKLIGRHGIQ
jgi:hypothetical protein